MLENEAFDRWLAIGRAEREKEEAERRLWEQRGEDFARGQDNYRRNK